MEDQLANIILDSPRSKLSEIEMQNRCFSEKKVNDYGDQTSRTSRSDVQPQESEVSGVVPFEELVPVAELPAHVEQTATSNLLKEMQSSATMIEDKGEEDKVKEEDNLSQGEVDE